MSSPAIVTSESFSNARPVTPVSQFAIQNVIVKSEILFSLHVCCKHLFYHSCAKLGLFQDMFSDSQQKSWLLENQNDT